MRCRNCGADFEDKRMECPYCGTPNDEGKRRAKLKEEKLEEYKEEKAEAVVEAEELAVFKSLTKVMFIMIGVCVGLVALVFLSGILWTVSADLQSGKRDAVLEKLKEEERYAKMDHLLSGYDYYRTDRSLEFRDLARRHSYVLDFRIRLEGFKKASVKDIEEDDVNKLLSDADRILMYHYENRTIPSYEELKEENKEFYDDLVEEVTNSLILYGYMTQEEIDSLFSEDDLDRKDYIESIIERKKEDEESE